MKRLQDCGWVVTSSLTMGQSLTQSIVEIEMMNVTNNGFQRQ